MKMIQREAETRKGPWTEQEDIVLINFVQLFGDRRWDFIAKVSGLNRTGKSCRLRWVNYLHPGLKRGKLTSQEEKLVLQLHAKWGNRWSKIARNLPGRTDNEIKNYWRTLMRKQAQERKRSTSPSSSSESNVTAMNPSPEEASFYDTGGRSSSSSSSSSSVEELEGEKGFCCYSMDDIWKDIEKNSIIEPVFDGCFSEENCYVSCPSMVSPPWECFSPDSKLWKMDEELSYEYGTTTLLT